MEQTSSPQTAPQPLDLEAAMRRVLGSGRLDWEDTACQEVLRILDEYVEKMCAGDDVSECMPMVKEHLDECPECCADCNALLRVLGFGEQSSAAGDP